MMSNIADSFIFLPCYFHCKVTSQSDKSLPLPLGRSEWDRALKHQSKTMAEIFQIGSFSHDTRRNKVFCDSWIVPWTFMNARTLTQAAEQTLLLMTLIWGGNVRSVGQQSVYFGCLPSILGIIKD